MTAFGTTLFLTFLVMYITALFGSATSTDDRYEKIQILLRIAFIAELLFVVFLMCYEYFKSL